MMMIMPGGRIGSRAGRFGFAAGTTMLFIQAAAPLGWTRVTVNDDALLRINGSTTPSTGGSNGFVSVFNSQTGTGTGTTGTGTSGATTISTATMPAHAHTISAIKPATSCAGTSFYGQAGTAANPAPSTDSNGSGGSHTHTVPGLSIPSLSITTGIKYVDALVARKN